jgi:glycosyltransferase involved in cell wall biosynthesis
VVGKEFNDRQHSAVPRIHVHATCWNEERMLPYFLRHYEPIAERIFIYDDGSTDASLDILKQCPKVTIESIQCEGDCYVQALRRLYNQCWQRSRGAADWVIVCNVDEHFHHPSGLVNYLAACQQAGFTIIPSRGYEMVSLMFPPAHVQLSKTLRRGVNSPAHWKTEVFAPDAIEASDFGVGRHTINPVGRVLRPEVVELRLLHYKHLGFGYLRSRYAQLNSRRRNEDLTEGYGYQYDFKVLKLLNHFVSLLWRARTVVDAGGGT